jgi:hypothetical protein
MDFQGLCNRIDLNKSTKIHNYYQKLLTLLFMQNQDPFNRQLLSIDVEKKIGAGLADLYLKWEKDKKVFTEIIEIELGGRKKNLENKIRIYSKKADLFSICVPSKKLDSIISIFPKMRKDLNNIKIVYLIDDKEVSRNRRKLIKDQKMVISAQSPFFFINPKKSLGEIKEFLNSKKNLFFDALLPIYLK